MGITNLFSKPKKLSFVLVSFHDKTPELHTQLPLVYCSCSSIFAILDATQTYERHPFCTFCMHGIRWKQIAAMKRLWKFSLLMKTKRYFILANVISTIVLLVYFIWYFRFLVHYGLQLNECFVRNPYVLKASKRIQL